MWEHSFYFFCVLILLLANVACWFGTLLSLPGNWGILLLSAGFYFFITPPEGFGITSGTLYVLLGLALCGEAIEALAGTAGTAKSGGSRRSMALSLVGALAGSIAGAVVGLPIPLIGSAIAAVVGGAVGAFGGAVIGESWKGQPFGHQMNVGKAAFWGRIFGTVGKLVTGIIMVVIPVVDALL